MTTQAKYALLGVGGALYMALLAYFFLRGWWGEAFAFLSAIPIALMGWFYERKGYGCGACCGKRRPREEEA